MNFIEVMPKLVGDPDLTSCQVQAPSKSHYLAAVATAIKQSSSSNYFGLYYSGSTMAETGDWAVYDDN